MYGAAPFPMEGAEFGWCTGGADDGLGDWPCPRDGVHACARRAELPAADTPRRTGSMGRSCICNSACMASLISRTKRVGRRRANAEPLGLWVLKPSSGALALKG